MNQVQERELLSTLKLRFEDNRKRHPELEWGKLIMKLQQNPQKLQSLFEMERTGGEPDVVLYDKSTDTYTFIDCALESPKGRRSICYDAKGQMEREKKGVHPAGNMVDMAKAMGIEPLTEAQYLELQKLGPFDTKTQSWLSTPEEIRSLGGAIFGHYHFGRVFISANTAPSFYSSRGFRGALQV